MTKNRYDIFISYRRKDSCDKAEHLKDLLESKFKKRISFDRENLTGLFDVALAHRIDVCKDFLLVVGKNSLVFEDKDFQQEQVDLYNYLGTCSQQEFEQKIVELGPNAPIDFVRIEIAHALHRKDLNIIPVVPEATESFNFSKLNLPDDIVGIKRYEAVFYSDNPDALFKDIILKILPRLKTRPSSIVKKWMVALLFLLLAVLLCVGLWQMKMMRYQEVMQSLKIEKAFDGQQYLNWSEDVTQEQLEAINHILSNMVPIDGGSFMMGAAPTADGSYDRDVNVDLETPPTEKAVSSFWIGKYEVSISEWCKVMEMKYDKQKADLPMTDVTFDECMAFDETLNNLTGLNFRLPLEAVWEYAARGGANTDSTKYAGSDNLGYMTESYVR